MVFGEGRGWVLAGPAGVAAAVTEARESSSVVVGEVRATARSLRYLPPIARVHVERDTSRAFRQQFA